MLSQSSHCQKINHHPLTHTTNPTYIMLFIQKPNNNNQSTKKNLQTLNLILKPTQTVNMHPNMSHTVSFYPDPIQTAIMQPNISHTTNMQLHSDSQPTAQHMSFVSALDCLHLLITLISN